MGLFNNYVALKLPFFNPPTPHHHASSRMIEWLRYVTPNTDTSLYHLFLLFEDEKKPKTRTRSLLYGDLFILRHLFLWASTSFKYSCNNPSPSEEPMVKKNHILQNILKLQNVNFECLHLNFEWKHSNLRLRLYPLWIKIIDKYKMIAKILWPLIQVNLPLMFYINEIPVSLQ